MIERLLDWYDGRQTWMKILLLVPVLAIGIIGAMLATFRSAAKPAPKSVITDAREKQEQEIKERRERTDAMIAQMEKESQELEERRAQAVKESRNVHEAIDDADSFDDVDRARSSQR